MDDAPLYSYHLSGRRAVVICALIASIIMLTIGFYFGAPWYFLMAPAAAIIMTLLAIISNHQAGSILTADALHFYNRGTSKKVLICEIATMSVTRWSDGPDTIALTLKSGHTVHVPAISADSKLAVALQKLGIGA